MNFVLHMLCQGKILKIFVVSLGFPYNNSLGRDELDATYFNVVPVKAPQDIGIKSRISL